MFLLLAETFSDNENGQSEDRPFYSHPSQLLAWMGHPKILKPKQLLFQFRLQAFRHFEQFQVDGAILGNSIGQRNVRDLGAPKHD